MTADSSSPKAPAINPDTVYQLRWRGRAFRLSGAELRQRTAANDLPLACLVESAQRWQVLEQAFSDFAPPRKSEQPRLVAMPAAGSKTHVPGLGPPPNQPNMTTAAPPGGPSPPLPPVPQKVSRYANQDYEELDEDDIRTVHSRLGIASFSIIMTVGVLFLILSVLAEAMIAEMLRSGDFSETGMTAVGLGALLLVAAGITSLGLGIGGIAQSRRRRVFAVLGTVFSSLFLLFIANLIFLA
jgi:hypothetical protein